MNKTPAQIVLALAALSLLIEPLGDGWLGLGVLVDNHVGSPDWPDHAKFHVIRQGVACIFTGLVCAWGILTLWEHGKGVRITFAILPFLLNVSAFIAALLAPIWDAVDFATRPGIGGYAIALTFILTFIGLYLEARERKADSA